MLNAKALFVESISQAKDLSGLFGFLKGNVIAQFPFDDLLRHQVVYSVSAFDKLMHDVIRIGLVQIFTGIRTPTDRYNCETISIQVHASLVSATIPPKEHLFEQEIVRKLGYLSFQDPTKVSEGLALIWNEKHKWQKIAQSMGEDPKSAKTRLKLISDRRNAIVHESDMHPLTNARTTITQAECDDLTNFVERCGIAICDLVI